MAHAPLPVRLLSAACLVLACATAAAADSGPRVATFRCDVTPPVGQPLFSGDPVETVAQPLLAKGIVLEADGRRHVLCAIDWCLVGNGTHESLRQDIARAAATDPAGVAVQTVHQHNAPMVDDDARRLLARYGDATGHVDPEWLAAVGRRLAAAVEESLDRLEPFDRIGTGLATVERVASNRRVHDASGRIAVRTSLAAAALRPLPEGTIDPAVRTITLSAGDRPLVRLHFYATHPQVRYGNSIATSDFVGTARETLEDEEHVFQVSFTGCAGDITVGKYNDGSDRCREEFAARLLAGMRAAVAATVHRPVGPIRWRSLGIAFPRRTDTGFTAEECIAGMRNPQIAPAQRLFRHAMRLASLQRADRPVAMSSLQIGEVHIVNLPGEPMVEFQLHAQQLRPEAFVAVAGYGDAAPGYLCTARAYAEGGYEPGVSNVAPESENLLKQGIASLLGLP